jgi:N-carbamoyl-L-amino-acid hydrolase
MRNNLRINGERLCWRLDRLAQIGRIPGDGVCRLALSEEDKQGRDLVVEWMHGLGLSVRIDSIGDLDAHSAGRVL